MIVLHRCLPQDDIFQICRFNLNMFIDQEASNVRESERVGVMLGNGRLRGDLHEEMIGPYHVSKLDQLLSKETQPLLWDHLDSGFKVAVANGILADHFEKDLNAVEHVDPTAMAVAYEKARAKMLKRYLSDKQQCYLRELTLQGQQVLPINEQNAMMDYQPQNQAARFSRSSRRGPTPRSRHYNQHISKLGQLSLFDDAELG